MNPVFSVVVPVFSIVLLSFGLTRVGIFNANTSEGLTRFMFYVAVPAMLFQTLATAELPTRMPWEFIAAFYGASFIMFFIGASVARSGFGWTARDQGIAAITASYSNMVMLGLPLTLAAFGDAAAVPLFILLALQSTLLFPATTAMIELYGHKADAPRPSLILATAKLLMNPVILSLVLGVIANFMSFSIRGGFAAILDTLGAAAPACALVALGAGLAQHRLRGDFSESLVLVLLKGIVHPALVWVGCTVMGIDALWTKVAILLAAMPTGINAYIFARNYGIRVAIVSKSIVLSTVLSTITVSLLLHKFLE